MTTTTATRTRYRLAMSTLVRALRIVVLVVVALLFIGMLASGDLEPAWAVVSVLGLVLSVGAIRILSGAVVVVREEGLRIQRNWPIRRDIPWYRINEVEVVPITWVLHIELNNGEQIELPAVEHLDELFSQVEELRQRLDHRP